jgi:homoserine O-acetyltransferase
VSTSSTSAFAIKCQRTINSSLVIRRTSTHFPCLDDKAQKEKQVLKASLNNDGPEPSYTNIVSGYKTFYYTHPFQCQYGGHLPTGFQLAYETWGTLNQDRSNAILLHTGLSASSHARSHDDNRVKGWWQDFIGPGKSLDTDKFFVICSNVLGSCYGSTGPMSLNSDVGKPWATQFPAVTVLVGKGYRCFNLLIA